MPRLLSRFIRSRPKSRTATVTSGESALTWFKSDVAVSANTLLIVVLKKRRWNYCFSMALDSFARRKPTQVPRKVELRGLMALAAITGLLVAAPMFPAGKASAFCDAADCVPNVARDVVPGLPCESRHFYVFGLDSNSRTYVCNLASVWTPTGPLVGIREVALACDAMDQSAQEPDGTPLKCAQVNRTLRWVHRDDTPG